MAHTDIVRTGWVARLPLGWQPYALLARADRPIGFWLLFLPGLWSIGLAAPDAATGAWLLALFGLGSIVMRAAGCVVNDMWDRDLDRRVARTATRPIASGEVTPRQALLFLAAQLAVGLAILLQLNQVSWLLGVLVLGLVFSYPLAKRVTDWPQAVLGLTFNWGALLGYAAVTGTLAPAAAVAYAAGFFWTLGYDTIYAHQDREDDAIVGVRSSALALGPRTGPALVAFYAVAVALLAVAAWSAGLGPWTYAGLAALAVHFGLQVATVDIDDPKRCLAVFRSNRDAGLIVALAIVLG